MCILNEHLRASQHIEAYNAYTADGAWFLRCYGNGRYRDAVYLCHVMLAPGEVTLTGTPGVCCLARIIYLRAGCDLAASMNWLL